MTRRPHARLGAGFWAWVGVVFAGLGLVVGAGRVLHGGLLAGAGFALAAVLRLILPEERAGGLHIRSRRVDAATYALVGIAVAVTTVLVHLREGR